MLHMPSDSTHRKKTPQQSIFWLRSSCAAKYWHPAACCQFPSLNRQWWRFWTAILFLFSHQYRRVNESEVMGLTDSQATSPGAGMSRKAFQHDVGTENSLAQEGGIWPSGPNWCLQDQNWHTLVHTHKWSSVNMPQRFSKKESNCLFVVK